MKEGLLEKIQSVGHWRVNFRPLTPLATNLTLVQCGEAVEQNRVELRGWDYPHVSRAQNESGGFANVGEYYENWCDWNSHVEFFRMYRSSQFLHYRALWEDFDPHDFPPRPRPPGALLSVGSAIYTVTEIVEFLFRMHRSGHYTDGVHVSVSIRNTGGRQLWINDPMRMGFYDEKRTEAQEVTIVRTFGVADLAGEAAAESLGMTKELFDHFGWTPTDNQISSDQERLYKRSW